MDRTEALPIFKSLYGGVDGFWISRQERLAYKNTDSSLTYGEITFDSFASLLSFVDVKEGEIFYDLGCGTGKPVILSALLEPFSKCIGIEILADLYDKACDVQKKLDTQIRPDLDKPIARVSYIHKDMFDVDFSDGDVFYVAATCFNDAMMLSLVKKIETCKIGARFIILSQGVPLDELYLLSHVIKKMSWGDCAVWIYKKVR